MLDDGTTTLLLCDELDTIEHVTVISNSLAVCEKLRAKPNVQLVLTGGNCTDTLQGFYGLICEQTLSRLRADWAFLSAPAAIGSAFYHQDQEVVRMKRALMASAERSVLLLTASKFQARALNHFADLTEFDRIFIDRIMDRRDAEGLGDRERQRCEDDDRRNALQDAAEHDEDDDRQRQEAVVSYWADEMPTRPYFIRVTA